MCRRPLGDHHVAIWVTDKHRNMPVTKGDWALTDAAAALLKTLNRIRHVGVRRIFFDIHEDVFVFIGIVTVGDEIDFNALAVFDDDHVVVLDFREYFKTQHLVEIDRSATDLSVAGSERRGR